jgi:hypothetical protein
MSLDAIDTTQIFVQKEVKSIHLNVRNDKQNLKILEQKNLEDFTGN